MRLAPKRPRRLSSSLLVALPVIIAAGYVAVWKFNIYVTGMPETNTRGHRVEDDPVTELRIQEFCGACHAVPQPTVLPRATWPDEIAKAFRRYRASGRTDLAVPDQAVITDYFCRLAAEAQVIPNAPENTLSPILFKSETINLPPTYQMAAVSFLNVERQRTTSVGSASDLLLCDMGSGGLHRFHWNVGKVSNSLLGNLKNPAHIVCCDFDHDGNADYLVADLGTMQPSDERQGSVVIVRASAESGRFELIPVHHGLGRVADVELADLDGDGDDDFIVAEFGFEKVGSLLWLETLSIEDGRLNTKPHVIDNRHGPIHAPATDLDGDGDLDVIALISQEHETIVAFMNDGNGQFEPRTLFEANNPAFSSSGMELVDLDSDGDCDVLFTNGDTLDAFQLRPSHAVNWLENMGAGKFEYHHITAFPGAVRAIAADLDGDGDQDVAAVAFCPIDLRHQVRPTIIDTTIWLEQKSRGQFERHMLARSQVGHMAITAGDFDGDSDLDLAVGEFAPYTRAPRDWLRIYWNQSAAPKN